LSIQFKSNLDYLKNYLNIARKIKEIVKNFDTNAKVYVFGSVVRGNYTANSDIDIIIITSKIEQKYDMMVAIYKELIYAPIELHIITKELYENWYRRFIKPEEIIEI